ncbi:hypothetical protein E1265_35170 [Streptomyces sp. 8K308]|uniref:hypothetical protein n=1 Tax=Streptomyces sp. 8K308 TaxID=2530388 RepID=UPI001050B090|nr:hypothetical protein [Streptomyces sp. 8K308]TDC05828.1 hypothetical protein E1265_35170 [Streptomyces sp. 8K308]
MSAARVLARQAQELREDAARTCADEIDAASDAGIQNRRWWEDAIHWVSENWDTIVEICEVVVAVLGIVVMIIGGPLAWVVLADTLYRYANGQATLWDTALDHIPGMKGLTTLGGLARGMRSLATTGLRSLRQGMRGLGQSIRRIGRGGNNLVCRTDPIDMATGEMVMEAGAPASIVHHGGCHLGITDAEGRIVELRLLTRRSSPSCVAERHQLEGGPPFARSAKGGG